MPLDAWVAVIVVMLAAPVRCVDVGGAGHATGALAMAAAHLGAHWRTRAAGEAAAADELGSLLGRVRTRLAPEEAMEASEQLARGLGEPVDDRVLADGSPAGWTSTSGGPGSPGEPPGILLPRWGAAGAAGCLDAPWRRALAARTSGLLAGLPAGTPTDQAWEAHSREVARPVRIGVASRSRTVGQAALAGALACPVTGLGLPASLGQLLAAPVTHAYTGPSRQTNHRDGPPPAGGGDHPGGPSAAAETALHMTRGSSVFVPGAVPVAMGQRPLGQEPSMLQRRRQGLLGAILHASRPGGGVDWELAGTRLVQITAGPPVVALRAAWAIASGAQWALRAAADASGAWEQLLALVEPSIVPDHIPLPGSERRPLGGQAQGSTLGMLEARLERGAAARAGLALAATRALAELPAAERAAAVFERVVRRPVRWAWRVSGAAWVWAQGWTVGDALRELVVPPRDMLYRRPEAVALRTAAAWLQRRVTMHRSAAEHAAAMAVVVSGGPVPHTLAALAAAGARSMQQTTVAPTPTNTTTMTNGGPPERSDTQAVPSWIQLAQSLPERAMQLLRPKRDRQRSGSNQDGPALARAAAEALRLVNATAAATAIDCGSAHAPCPAGASRQSLAAAALPMPPGKLGSTLMDLASVSEQLQAADALWATADPSRSGAGASAARVDWDGRLLRSTSSQVPGRAGLCVSGEKGECVAAPLGTQPTDAGVWWWWTGGLPQALAPCPLAAQLRVPGGLEAREVGAGGSEGASTTASSEATRWRLAAGVARLAVVDTGSADAVIVAALRRWGEGGVAEFGPVGAGWVPGECLRAAGQDAGALEGWTAVVAFGCGGETAVSVRKAVVSAGVCVLRMRGETPVACEVA